MKLSTFLAISGGLAILFGLEFLLVPEFGIRQYGLPTEPSNVLQARYFGGTLLPYGLMIWLARGLGAEVAQRAVLPATVAGNAIGVVLSVWAAISGIENAMAWSSVVIYGVLLAGSLYFLAAARTPVRTPA